MEPKVLYEDSEVIAVNKPAGLVVHSDGLPAQAGKTKEETLADWVMKKYPEIKDVGEPGKTSNGEIVPRPGIVHRLDRETSGVMLVAKTKESFENLKKQFQKHQIIKKYEAFVFGKMKDEFKTKEGVIDRPIGRSSSDFRRWSAQRGARGEMREAITHYKIINSNKDYSLVEVAPKTGRTHQIRVHFKAINHPLLADSLYSPGRENTLGFQRLALHSREITYKDTKGEKHTIQAPYPEDFEKAKVLLQRA